MRTTALTSGSLSKSTDFKLALAGITGPVGGAIGAAVNVNANSDTRLFASTFSLYPIKRRRLMRSSSMAFNDRVAVSTVPTSSSPNVDKLPLT